MVRSSDKLKICKSVRPKYHEPYLKFDSKALVIFWPPILQHTRLGSFFFLASSTTSHQEKLHLAVSPLDSCL